MESNNTDRPDDTPPTLQLVAPDGATLTAQPQSAELALQAVWGPIDVPWREIRALSCTAHRAEAEMRNGDRVSGRLRDGELRFLTRFGTLLPAPDVSITVLATATVEPEPTGPMPPAPRQAFPGDQPTFAALPAAPRPRPEQAVAHIDALVPPSTPFDNAMATTQRTLPASDFAGHDAFAEDSWDDEPAGSMDPPTGPAPVPPAPVPAAPMPPAPVPAAPVPPDPDPFAGEDDFWDADTAPGLVSPPPDPEDYREQGVDDTWEDAGFWNLDDEPADPFGPPSPPPEPTAPVASPGPELLEFAAHSWRALRREFQVEGGRLLALRSPRPGFDYGAEGHGRDAMVCTHEGSTDWGDYEVDLEFGVDPHDAGGSFFLYYRVQNLPENWNDPTGTNAYRLALTINGTWALTRMQGMYCPVERGYAAPAARSGRHLAKGRDRPLRRHEPNQLRLRVEGERTRVWLNGAQLTDFRDAKLRPHETELATGGIALAWQHEGTGWAGKLSVEHMDPWWTVDEDH